MPHRTFNLDEAAAYLHLDRTELERLVSRDEIPFEKQGDRVVFRKARLDAWGSQRILGLSGSKLESYHRKSSVASRSLTAQGALIPALLTVERIDAALPSRTKPSVLRATVALADRTGLVSDPAELLAALEQREELCSTALPGGFALLHPRQHEPYMFIDSFAVLGRTVQGIHAGADDGEPTDLFFLVCCQEDRIHLHVLARLCTMAQSTRVLQGLREAGDAAAMLAVLVAAEEEVVKHL